MNRHVCFFLFFSSFAVLVPSLQANIEEFDEYWAKRAEEAQKDALKAYDPHPETVTSLFNAKVDKSV